MITTPSHMSRLLRAEAAAPILRDASLGLASLDPALSAKAGLTPAQRGFAMTVIAGATFALGLAPQSALAFISLSMTCFFLASIWLRLFAGAASTASVQEPYRPSVEDRWLPVYSIAVALCTGRRASCHNSSPRSTRWTIPVLWRNCHKLKSSVNASEGRR